MADELLWFPFYVHRFMGSRKVQRMTADMVGGYTLLLVDEWRNGPIPTVDAARISRLDDAAAMRLLCDCFTETPNGWINDALEEVREEQESRARVRSKAGTVAAKARWGQGKNANRNAAAMRSDAIREEKKREEEKKEETACTHAELSIWMGDQAAVLSAVDRYTQAAIWGIWGPNGTQAHDWKGIEPPRQQAIMGTVILTYAAEGKHGFHRPFFSKILTRAVEDAIASDRQEDQRRTEGTTANESREQARRLEEAEIARLNAEAMKTAAPGYREPQTKHTRISGLEKISA